MVICLRSRAALPCTRRSRDRLTVRMRIIYACGQCVPVQCAPTRATKKSANYINPNSHCILATSSANSSFKKRVQILPYKKSCRLKKGLLIWGPTSLCSPKFLLLTLLTVLISPWKNHTLMEGPLIVDVCVLAECMLEVVRFLPRGDEECKECEQEVFWAAERSRTPNQKPLFSICKIFVG